MMLALEIHDALVGRAAEMVADVRRLVEVESPTSNVEAVTACADVVSEVGTRVTGVAPERRISEGRPHLFWRLGEGRRIGLVGHFDTVWPIGTLALRPYREEAGRAFGPGIFDMKCGVVQAFYAAAAIPGAAVDILLTSDEETGSRTSRALIESASREWRAALILEASQEGHLKVARKGVSEYDVTISGRESHAGLEPEKGVNALVELAHVVLAIDRLGAPRLGTSVSATIARAGTAGNVIPATAEVHVDVRTLADDETRRVHAAMTSLQPTVPGATVDITGGPNRAPMATEMSADLFARARRLYADLGYGEVQGVAVGGGSDGNLTAGAGVPTLDGLGAVGAGAHAVHEHIVLDEVPRRAALVAALIGDITA